jgi:coenzyme Q-binding protein COQ10
MHAKASIHVTASAESADRLCADTDRWPEWYVGLGKPEEIVGDGGPGALYRFTLTPPGAKPIHMTSKVKAHELGGDGSIHWFSEYTGDYVGWERWDYVPEDGGAAVTLELESEPAKGALMKIMARLFFQRPFQRNVEQSLVNLKRLIETE